MDLRLAQPDAPSASREILADGPARPAGPVRSSPHGALPGSAHFSLSKLFLRCAGSRADRPVVDPLYGLDRTVTHGPHRSSYEVRRADTNKCGGQFASTQRSDSAG